MGFQLKSDPNSYARLRIYDDENINWRYHAQQHYLILTC